METVQPSDEQEGLSILDNSRRNDHFKSMNVQKSDSLIPPCLTSVKPSQLVDRNWSFYNTEVNTSECMPSAPLCETISLGYGKKDWFERQACTIVSGMRDLKKVRDLAIVCLCKKMRGQVSFSENTRTTRSRKRYEDNDF